MNSIRIKQAGETAPSRLIKTPDELSVAATDAQMPGGVFDFKCMVQTPEVILHNKIPNYGTGYDMEFDIPFDDDMVANESEIRIYNLTEGTRNKFKIGNSVAVTAGYGDDTGLVLQGWICDIKTECSGADTALVLYVIDSIDYDEKAVCDKIYEENTLASRILKDLLTRTGLEIAEFTIQRDYMYRQEVKVTGSLMDNIKTYSDVCGVSAYVNRQKIYCKPIWLGWNTYFTISPETGMIDSPEKVTESNRSEIYEDIFSGYKVKMLIQHRMNTAAIVGIKSKICKGDFRVVGGKHTYDGLSAVTEVKVMEKIDVIIHPDYNDANNALNSASYNNTKYSLSDVQKKALAKYVNKEAGSSVGGKKAVASHMCNMYEYWKWSKDSRAKGTLYSTIHGNHWYAADTRNNEDYGSDDIKAVEECICKGNRSIPPYVTEFDMWGGVKYIGNRNYTDIVSVSPTPSSDADLQQGTSVLKNAWGACGKFWAVFMYSNYGGNIFYYESDKYKEYCDSKYKTKASGDAKRFVETATAEEGVVEGSGNNQKYGEEMGANNEPWCGYFVAWCAKHAGISSSVIPWNSGNCGSAAFYAYAAEKKGIGTYHAKGSGYKPKPGDIFVKNYNGSDFASNGHVGIVRSYSSGDKFKSIEGNSSDKVNSQSLSIHNFTFVTPNWEK